MYQLKSWGHLALSKGVSGSQSRASHLCKAVLGHEEETFCEKPENRAGISGGSHREADSDSVKVDLPGMRPEIPL